jgi:hypothetical protein
MTSPRIIDIPDPRNLPGILCRAWTGDLDAAVQAYTRAYGHAPDVVYRWSDGKVINYWMVVR